MPEFRKETGGLRFFQEGSRKWRRADRHESQNEFAETTVTFRLRVGGHARLLVTCHLTHPKIPRVRGRVLTPQASGSWAAELSEREWSRI